MRPRPSTGASPRFQSRLSWTAPGGPPVAREMLLVTLPGLVAGFRVVQNWNWWGFPGSHSHALILDAVLGLAFMGLVIAAIVKPAR